MKTKTLPVDMVKPYERNPRNNDGAVEAVARSIEEFGFRVPIVVDDDNVVIAGHTRLLAAKKLGLAEIPVHVAEGLSPEKVKAFRIADNKVSELATWDAELLPIELAELQDATVDLSLLGFSDDELAGLLDPGMADGLTDPESIPEPPEEPETQPGDLWILGDHRLLCGDSSKVEDVDRLLGGELVQLVCTDPPYNVSVEPRSRNAIAAGLSSFPDAPGKQGSPGKMRAKDRPIGNDSVSDEEFDRLLDGWFSNLARVLEPGRAAYIWGGYANCSTYPPFLKKHGLYFSQAIIWHKMHPVLNRKDFMGDHEWIFYSWREGAAHKYFGPNNATDVWQVKKLSSSKTVHLTEKPVELAVRAIQYSSRAGENVLDLFGGSGSTLIGCEQTGRKAFVMELDAQYCDVIRRRWQEFTGREAERLPREVAA